MNKVEGCSFCYPSDKECILRETNNFYLVPSIGSIVKGYILLVTKYHIPSFGEMPEQLLNEFIALKCEVKTALEETYANGCIFYEHGIAGASMTLQQDDKISYHAHLHCVAVGIDLLETICNEYDPLKIREWQEIMQLSRTYPQYLYYENGENMYFFPVDIYVRRQYLRFCLAKLLGKPRAADWHREPGWQNIEDTVDKLSHYFSNR
jgi:ATP adenylyltransferase